MSRIFFFSLSFSIVLLHSLFSTTYVWEDYDDFSGPSLDTSRWEAVYFAGGQEASIEIDGNGYIKSLESDGDYQYYNPVSVENGVIGTIQNDQGVDSVANNGVNQVDQWFFTTRAAAEEYYYSKVNPKDWMWFDHSPWVYSNKMQAWLYFYPSGSKLMYWSNKGKAWRQFN